MVDDNTTNSRILECLLSSWSMLPALAWSGAEALRVMEEAYQSGTAFPLVLLDFQMPQMDGFAVAERIKKTEHLAAATIMMLTSGGKRGDAARCRELGVAAYLTKPIRQAELLDAICLALGKKSAEQKEAAPLITRHSIRERRRPLQVLVAEDNVVNQMLVVTLLMKAGHEVALVGNGVEAVATWKSQPFDVIMMDMQMPEMDGFEAVARIRGNEKESGGHIPIVAMTAHALVGDRDRCLAAGMDGYVSKCRRHDAGRDARVAASTDCLLHCADRGRIVPESHGPFAGQQARPGTDAGGLDGYLLRFLRLSAVTWRSAGFPGLQEPASRGGEDPVRGFLLLRFPCARRWDGPDDGRVSDHRADVAPGTEGTMTSRHDDVRFDRRG